MSKIIHFIGLDVHKESIAVSIAPSDSTEVRFYGTIGGRLEDVDQVIKRLARPGVELRFCYEAGPTGYPLCRHLRKQKFVCEVVAPSLIPKKSGDRGVTVGSHLNIRQFNFHRGLTVAENIAPVVALRSDVATPSGS